MSLVYLGTSGFAAAVLDRLAAGPHRPALVVSRPDRPRGRGRRVAPPPVAARAKELGIAVHQPEDLHAPPSLARIAEAAPDALVVCAFGAVVRAPLLDAYEILNVHPSLLPRWRGAAPIERAIMAGDAETGVCIMRLTEGLDTGPVCLAAREPIHEDDDYGSLSARLQALGGDLLVQALERRPPFAEQGEAGVTYAEKLTAADRALDPARTAVQLERVVRALRPHVGARAGPLGVWEARPAAASEGVAGRVVRLGERLVLGCAGGALELTRVQPPGGRAMATRDWLRGRPDPALTDFVLA